MNSNLGFIRTTHAREKIRQWFKRQERAENIARGKEMVEKELRRLGANLAGMEEALQAQLAAQAAALDDMERQHQEWSVAREQEVRAQLEEVRASRVRIVEAAHAERRRVERDLHDGAQQRLVALAMRLQVAKETTTGASGSSRLVTRPSSSEATSP